jgi:hypothetical protein
MNEPWDTQDNLPESIRVSDELQKREDDGFKVRVGKTWKVNWDDWLERLWNKMRGDK